MTASERRNAILEDLCMRRYEKVSNLAFQYGVTTRTIRNDILILSLEYPIYTAKGNGGGIYVDKNFRLGKVFLEKGTFEYNDKEYSSYFIAGKIKDKDVKVALMPPDKKGSNWDYNTGSYTIYYI